MSAKTIRTPPVANFLTAVTNAAASGVATALLAVSCASCAPMTAQHLAEARMVGHAGVRFM